MGEFFSNVSRYPKYLITIVLGVFTAAISPLIKRGSNPITAIALLGALPVMELGYWAINYKLDFFNEKFSNFSILDGKYPYALLFEFKSSEDNFFGL